ncbi:hypothetical protein ACTQ49_09545 [Luteococcus sp. Sow4_B9]|uniref:hypothetical protein n=1 Tax=Luteococcus sp. Sow4_B9 TaxID=3438792 RepID=UPI003F9DAA5E
MSVRRILAVVAVALLPLQACGSSSGAQQESGSSGGQSVSAVPNPTSQSDPAMTSPAGEVERSTPGVGSAAPTATVSVAVPKDLKKFDTAKLPTTVAGYSGEEGMYTGASEDDMLMMTLAPGMDFGKVVQGLQKPTTIGRATCGKADGVQSCFAALDGGLLWVQGTDRTSIEELAQVTNQVYDGFA